jgi:hypothetical protein
MIHSTRSMPSGNLAEPQRPFRFPADYYTAPLSEVRPIFPRWVPVGCGTASAVILVLLFVAGAWVSGPGLAQFMDVVIGTSLGELHDLYTPDVTKDEKERFDAEVERMRSGLRSGTVSLRNVTPFLEGMKKAISDKHVTSDEVEGLIKAAHTAAEAKKPATR